MNIVEGLEHVVRDTESLAPYTWFRMGGPAEYFAEPTTIDELSELVRRFREHDKPIRLLGGGSNVLVRDAGVPGLVVHLSAPAFSEIKVEGQRLIAGGGAKLGHVISTSVREGLAGFEQLTGIPGTIGGALHGNAGSHGGDIGQWARAATVMTRSGEVLSRNPDDLHFAYRDSSLDELVILEGTFELDEDSPQELTQRMQKLWIVKKATHPMGNQNAGCIFKDAGGMNAGSLIEQAGLKGTRVGEAEVSDRDANFVVAHAGATPSDVQRLVELIASQVSERLGVDLEMQIEVW